MVFSCDRYNDPAGCFDLLLQVRRDGHRAHIYECPAVFVDSHVGLAWRNAFLPGFSTSAVDFMKKLGIDGRPASMAEVREISSGRSMAVHAG